MGKINILDGPSITPNICNSTETQEWTSSEWPADDVGEAAVSRHPEGVLVGEEQECGPWALQGHSVVMSELEMN